MRTRKDDETESLRRQVLASPDVEETGRADCGLTTLSFHSMRVPNRHVWVDTDLADELVIDLEDWLNGERWDSAVEHLVAPDIETSGTIIIAWLSGRPLEDCRTLGGRVIDLL